MHQKKRTVILVIVLLLFVAAGGWYISHDMNQEEAGSLTGVLGPTLTVAPEEPEPTDIPVAVPVEKELLTVFICGEVVCPGVYELLEDGRLYEVIDLAGGFTEKADRAYHNLARQVKDGERIYILSCEETQVLELAERIAGETVENASSEQGASGTKMTALVNLNTADIEELTTLPGIGEAKAESILEYRERVGRFTSIEEVMNISGIGDAMFDKIKDRITVE